MVLLMGFVEEADKDGVLGGLALDALDADERLSVERGFWSHAGQPAIHVLRLVMVVLGLVREPKSVHGLLVLWVDC